MTEMGRRRIFHLLPASAWRAQAAGDAPIAADQLQRHGFVHCCTREQILEIATWWLEGQAPLVALELDAGAVGDVRFERADLGREYPHVYNALPRAALVQVHDLAAGEGVALPDALREPPPEFTVEGRIGGRAVAVRWRAGRFFDGDADIIERANALVAAHADVPQFPGVSRQASTAEPYDAFCLFAAVVDETTGYRGDGFDRADGLDGGDG